MKKNKKIKIGLLIFIAYLFLIYVPDMCNGDIGSKIGAIKYDNHIYQYSKTNLNIRKSPNMKEKVLKVIKPNEKVITYDSIVNGFVMVLDDNGTKYGWASSGYLQDSPFSKKQLNTIEKRKKIRSAEKIKKQEESELKINPLGIDKKVIKDLVYGTIPFEKWDEWGNPKTLEGTNNSYWVVLLPKSNISFVARKTNDLIIFADFGEEKAINYLKNIKKKNEVKVKKQFSSWNGSHRNLTSYVKRNMHDDDSYEHVKTVYWVYDDYIIVETKFRGTNAYGGKVLNSIKAKISFEGNILEIL